MVTPKTRKLWREVSGTMWDGAWDTSRDYSIMVRLTDEELALFDGILETMEKEDCIGRLVIQI